MCIRARRGTEGKHFVGGFGASGPPVHVGGDVRFSLKKGFSSVVGRPARKRCPPRSRPGRRPAEVGKAPSPACPALPITGRRLSVFRHREEGKELLARERKGGDGGRRDWWRGGGVGGGHDKRRFSREGAADTMTAARKEE